MTSKKRRLQAVPRTGAQTSRDQTSASARVKRKTLTVPIPESETKGWLKLYGLCQMGMIKRAGGEATDLTASQVARAAIKTFSELPHDQILKSVIAIYDQEREIDVDG